MFDKIAIWRDADFPFDQQSQVNSILAMAEKENPRVISRTQRRASRTRKRLLDAALALFNEKGLDATAIEDITERADVGKGTFYRHFGNKEAVVAALIEGAVDHLLDRMKPARVPQGLDDALEQLIKAHQAFFAESSNEFLLLFQGRLLLRLQQAAPAELEPAYSRYLLEMGKLISAFLPQPADPAKVRQSSAAIAGFVFVASSFARISPAEEAEKNMQPLTRSFVMGLTALLAR